jgi:hypothetical protein
MAWEDTQLRLIDPPAGLEDTEQGSLFDVGPAVVVDDVPACHACGGTLCDCARLGIEALSFDV